MICACIFFSQSYYNYTNKQLDIYYLNIGQGDSSLIKSPDNKLILVDGGPDQSVLTELSKILPSWIRKIDLIILTHYDLDHVAGLFEILQRFEVKNIILNIPDDKFLAQKFMQLVEDQKINYQFASASLDFVFGCCLQIDTLWPVSQDQIKDIESNAGSISFVLSYNKFRAFFGGDLPIKQEELITKQIHSTIQVLKTGHHGSRTSTSQKFVSKLQPQLAIISCGLDNRFYHPHPEVINILQQNEVTILRTDLLGTIQVRSDGQKFFYFQHN